MMAAGNPTLSLRPEPLHGRNRASSRRGATGPHPTPPHALQHGYGM